jgi:hypothetical protein
MGFLSFMGHRFLGVVMYFLAIVFFMAGSMPSQFGGLSPGWLWILISLLLLIGGTYFFKTQH